MTRFEVRVDDRKVRGALEKIGPALNRNCAAALGRIGRDFVKAVQAERFRGYTGTSGDKVQNRSSTLKNKGFFHDVSGSTLDDLALKTGIAGVKYGRKVEFGGDTVPTPPNQWLTIPLHDNLQANGQVRYPSARALMKNPPSEGKTFLFKSKKGTLLIGQKLTKGLSANGLVNGKKVIKRFKKGDTRLLWALVKKTHQQPRLGFRDLWAAKADGRTARIGLAVEKALAEAARG